MQIEIVAFNTDRYREMVQKREEWLRKPLGLSIESVDFSGDANEIHIAAVEDDRIIGVLLLRPLSKDRVKMRQVATHPDRIGQGIGKKLVHFSEDIAGKEGFEVIELNSRETAVPFYEKLGYEIVSDRFLEVTIPHYKMEKRIK